MHTPDDGLLHPEPVEQATPRIEVDNARLDRNLRHMQEKAAAAGLMLRPHVKTHKSLKIARRQVALGAQGLTASKPSEAEVFLDGGSRDILLAYPVVDAPCIDGMLARGRETGAALAFIADSHAGVSALALAARRHQTVLPVHLKVDVGLGRVGVKPTAPEALQIAQAIDEMPALSFAGLVSHAGHAYGADTPASLGAIAEREAACLSLLRARLESQGLSVPCISTGSTPTALGAPLWTGGTEARPGNYAFLDLTAVRIGFASMDDIALTVVARVVSVNERYAIIDAGSKTLSSDQGPHGTGDGNFGLAVVFGSNGDKRMMPIERLSEEHGFVKHEGHPPEIGSCIRIFPKHACAVIALADTFILRGENGARSLETIDARGKVT